MKKRNENTNKGFSLVELIVVIAIMAVLLVVLAPQFLKYVEKTRWQKDNSAIAEIANAMKVACADEKVNEDTPTGSKVTIINPDKAAAEFDTTAVAKTKFENTGTKDELKKELASVIGTYKTSSNTYRDSSVDIEFTITNDAGIVSIEVKGWIDEPGTTTTITKTF